nr:MAG TPA: hypothetical protein [Caudoviricetes sp.]
MLFSCFQLCFIWLRYLSETIDFLVEMQNFVTDFVTKFVTDL